MIVLLVGFTVFFNSIITKLNTKYGIEEYAKVGDTKKDLFGVFLENNAKLIILSFVPLFALNSYMLFRRKKYNISEHFIISGMSFLGVMIITTLTGFLFLFDYTVNFGVISDVSNVLTPCILIIYIASCYYATFKENYSKSSIFFRIFIFFLLLLIELGLFSIVAISIFKKYF